MAEIKWIKIVTNIFDDEKILLIETLPDADSIIVIWFKLLCLAGKQNNSGVFVMGNGIPYTDKMLSTIFRRKEAIVTLAISTFEQFGMVEIVDNTITIPNWGKHQTLDKIESKNKYMRQYMREYRERQRLLVEANNDCKFNSKTNVSSLDKNKIREEEDKNKIREERDITAVNAAAPAPYSEIVDLFNSTCTSLPKINRLSDARKKAIKARLNTYSVDDFRKLFEIAENSTFLKGGNNRNWSATFDWLIKDSNMAKVLDGNYADKASGGKVQKDYDEEF